MSIRNSKNMPVSNCWLFLLVALIVLLQSSKLSSQENNTTVFTLNACIEAALQNNPHILGSGFTVDQSRVQINEARAGFYPNLSFSASGSQSTRENSLTSKENWSSGFSAHYTLFQGFKTVASVNAVKANYHASRAQHESNQHELIMMVTEAYYRLLQSERLVKVAVQSVQRARLHLDFSNARFKAGLANRSDVLKTTVELSDVQLSLIRARNVKLSAQGQLNIQMGRAVHLSLEIMDDLETSNADLDSSSLNIEDQFNKFLKMAFQNRPELDKLERQIKAQQANINYARGDYLPILSLDGSYTYSGETMADLNSSSYIGMSLSFPLFSGFSRPSRVEQENLALHNLQQQQESVRQQIGLEVWNAYLQVKEAVERIANSRIFNENALENRNIAEGEYREGLGSMLDVIDAQTALVNSEQTLIEALADYKIARATLERAVGMKNIEEILK